MKRTFAVITSVAALMFATSTINALANDKETTISGEAKCAKCMLKEGKECQTVIQVEKEGKTETYYVVNNDVSKGFHDDVCTSAKKVTATGTVAKVDGKQQLTLSKIEVK
jgi:hypothetical protein